MNFIIIESIIILFILFLYFVILNKSNFINYNETQNLTNMSINNSFIITNYSINNETNNKIVDIIDLLENEFPIIYNLILNE